uniref:IQ motif containing B1 n=1 Tax=Hippocampus comes TaxID=109280 RepID=A0A3Q2YXC8_HIPCM
TMEQPEEAVMHLKRQVEDSKLLNVAAEQKDTSALTRVKSLLYQNGILSHCVTLITLNPQRPQRCFPDLTFRLSACHLSSCCVGVEPGELSETFHRLFLPSVADGLLSLASHLARRADCVSPFRKVMDSVSCLLRAHAQLTAQVVSSSHYELIQCCDEVTMSLLCVQMWTDICTANSLLDKDWRGRGFDPEVDQLIALTQSQESTPSGDRERAASVIQAAWKSYLTRRRVKSLGGVVSMLQRRFRSMPARVCLAVPIFQIRRFLQEHRAAKVLASAPCWIGQKGLTESKRAALKRRVDEYISLHPVSRQACEQLHVDVQWRLRVLLQQAVRQTREEQKMESLLARTHTQLDLLKDAPPLSAVTATDIKSFLSPCGTIATRARDAHIARLQANRLPWWRTLGETTAGLESKVEVEDSS